MGCRGRFIDEIKFGNGRLCLRLKIYTEKIQFLRYIINLCRKNWIISTYHDSYVKKTVKFVHKKKANIGNRNTLEYLGIWEKIHNPDFNYGEFATITSKAGLGNDIIIRLVMDMRELKEAFEGAVNIREGYFGLQRQIYR